MPGSPGKKSWAVCRARVVRAGFPEVLDLKGWAGTEPAESNKWGKGLESSVWARAVRAGFLEEAQNDNTWWLILYLQESKRMP